MTEGRDQQSLITRTQFLMVMTITWLYILIVVGRLLSMDHSWPNIALFAGAIVMYLAQLIPLCRSRKR